jgi:carboxymethylenebutenolidase
MGEMVDIPSDGNEARGYLSKPAQGAGPGVIVVQEWWGLNPQIKRVCDRLSSEGFTALAPDLYRGELASHTELDKAAQLVSALPIDRAARDMSGAVDYLAKHESVRGDGVGAVGFCMGGRLVLLLAANRPDKIACAVSYYGVIPDPSELDLASVRAAVQGHYATNDGFMPLDAAREVERRLKEGGADVDFYYYDAGHAFANEDDAIGTYDEDAARQAWVRTLEFLRAHLG